MKKVLIRHFWRILQISIDNGVDVIHAHTPYRVGFQAYQAAKKIGIPFVYEMRGMWKKPQSLTVDGSQVALLTGDSGKRDEAYEKSRFVGLHK